MDLKKLAINVLGAVVFILVSFQGSSIYSAENIPPGNILPDFELKGPTAPQTKAYLGINNEKLFSFSQIKTKLVLVEFFDVF